jgi:hypothetical protein
MDLLATLSRGGNEMFYHQRGSAQISAEGSFCPDESGG